MKVNVILKDGSVFEYQIVEEYFIKGSVLVVEDPTGIAIHPLDTVKLINIPNEET